MGLAWSRRVRRVGGFIQVGFAAFWLIRGSQNVHGVVGVSLAVLFVAAVIAAIGYGIRVTAGKAPRPISPEGKRIERAPTSRLSFSWWRRSSCPSQSSPPDPLIEYCRLSQSPSALYCSASTTASTSRGTDRWTG